MASKDEGNTISQRLAASSEEIQQFMKYHTGNGSVTLREDLAIRMNKKAI